MRLQTYRSLAIAMAALAANIACQSAQKQTFFPPVEAQAPALKATKAPAPAPAPSPEEPKPVAAAPEPPSKAQPAAADAAAELIARVEKEYQAGQESYKKGNLEAAKKSFDAAVNLLLNASDNLRSDDRLDRELDRVMEGINGLDLLAAQDGEGPQQKQEPAPIDEANEQTPTVDASVKAKAEAEVKSTHSDLPLMMTDQVAGFINFFSNRGRGTLERALARSGRYEEMIRRILKQEGVPQDLIYLAQAESGFHSLAVSRAGARGMWQFMGSRAKGYGLQRNFWVDERQDPEKATRAAAHHLKDLYAQFGDWYLAMAAYNSGPGRVQSAVKRTGYADFWELYRRDVLPKETRNYVPIILAVTIMAKNPEQYGLDDVNRDQPIPYDTVKIDYPIDLRLLAQCVNATPAELQELNPSLLRLSTPKDGTFDLHLPVGTKKNFEAAVAAIPADKRLWWRYHDVKDGDTLASLARTYHTTSRAISEANKLDDDSLESQTRLVIPIVAGKFSDTGTYAHRITRYKVHKGDTVETVAENFAVPVKMVRSWNRLKGNSLAGRKVLYLHLPVTPGVADTHVATTHSRRSRKKTTDAKVSPPSGVVHHRVKSGETLYSIASSYNTTVAALQRNNRNTSSLRPGMILVVRAAR
ncbi:MAG: transglycosylase SLT domain-containing protein [Acidobacteria bacterium]|nr:transglycosylase SLT domain-containing protein [Acidobacteriota bacterium]